MSPSSRRRWSRIPIRRPVELRANERLIEAQAYNIAFGGITVKSPEPLEPGAAVSLRVHLPGTRVANSLDATGRVMHVSAVNCEGCYRLGVEFDPLDERNAAVLETFFAEQRARRRSAEGRPHSPPSAPNPQKRQ
ncbi:MAG: PilZ domain-containing protein [Gammaproteobacteria bacterium]|nr:PilZ domain-containing protein [Gammaproteobacteria bacterium]NIT63395.1 PilZ domain-containing protein [Gammaproteobacteria bacterium]NIX10202.1 hypothetical protein [Gammaproteobacteria bacterium]NIY31975.1 hypothetical protein [Gammaproteobacteria bacterium]